jgi:transcription antitermination factor NusG
MDAPEREPRSDRVRLDPGATGRWHVLHTRSRQEKALCEVLGRASISCYLPLVRHVRYYGHRRRVVEAPLFPGYVFLRGERDDAFFAVSTKRAAAIVDVPDQIELEHDLTQIRMALAGGLVGQAFAYLREGRRVRVARGPFAGLEGIVDERIGEDRIVLIVRALGRATSLEIDASLLEVLD